MADLLAFDSLSRRERQVLDIIIRLETATARDIERELPDPPTYSAVRSILRILTSKGFIQKKWESGRDVYTSTVPSPKARNTLLKDLMDRFFGSSVTETACALLGRKDSRLTDDEADRLIKLIEEARRR